MGKTPLNRQQSSNLKVTSSYQKFFKVIKLFFTAPSFSRENLSCLPASCSALEAAVASFFV
jgi:hypothetical protein